MKRKKKSQAKILLFSPRYWLTWLALGLMWLMVKILPFPFLLKIGQKLGRLMCRFLPRRRKIVQINLTLCFPELSADERECLVGQVFESMGIAVFENAFAWWWKDKQIAACCIFKGWENYEQALATGKAIILCTGHFTTLEFAGRALAQRLPYYAIYRRQKNPVFNFVMKRARKKHLPKIIDREDARAMINALKDHVPLWIAPDQDYGRDRSVFVPFFNFIAASITSVAKLAKLGDAVVLTYYSYRCEHGYEIHFQPMLSDFPSHDLTKDTLRINQILEAGIRRDPSQYLWLHRRFKTRPLGEKKIY